MTVNRTLLHQLWSKAVGTPNYNKQQWIELENHLKELESLVKELEQSRRREANKK